MQPHSDKPGQYDKANNSDSSRAGARRSQEMADVAGKWHSRGYLPHADKLHLMQSISFRLSDSLPQSLLKKLEKYLEKFPEHERDINKREKIELWLASGMGCCALKNHFMAKVVQDALLHFDGERYHLVSWCIMPNHVHVLIDPITKLGAILQSWKSFTGRWALANNERLGLNIPLINGKRTFWMREYHDRFIRNKEHYQNEIDYIHMNPVKAGLCKIPEQWQWSSIKHIP